MYTRLENRVLLSVKGRDAKKYIHAMTTNDVLGLSPGAAQYTALLNNQGRVLFDGFLACVEEEYLLLDCHAAVAAPLLQHLALFKLRNKVKFEDVTASHHVWSVVPRGKPGGKPDVLPLPEGFSFADPRHPSLGHRVIATSDQPPPGIEAAPYAAYDILRLACGCPDGPSDVPSTEAFPLEHNLESLQGVSFRKGCYLGQELTARTYHTGVTRKRILPVIADGPEAAQDEEFVTVVQQLEGIEATAEVLARLRPATLPAAGTEVRSEGQKRAAGSLRTSRYNLGLAHLRLQMAFAAEPNLSAGETQIAAIAPPWLPVAD